MSELTPDQIRHCELHQQMNYFDLHNTPQEEREAVAREMHELESRMTPEQVRQCWSFPVDD